MDKVSNGYKVFFGNAKKATLGVILVFHRKPNVEVTVYEGRASRCNLLIATSEKSE